MPYGDMQATAWLAGLISPGLTGVMQDISLLGSTGVMIALVAITALWLLLRKRRQDLRLLLLAYGGGEMSVELLKSYFQRPRPPAPLVLVHAYSFPSGHAFNIMLICGFVTYLLWPVWRRAWARGLILVAALSLIVAGGIQSHLFKSPLAGRRSGRVRARVSLAAHQQGTDHRLLPGSGPARPGP